MKTLFATLLIALSAPSWAGKCTLSGLVNEGMTCGRITTRLEVSDVEACAAFAKATKQNNFFNILDRREVLLSTRYTYKEKKAKKIKETIEFESDEVCY